jgi:hypothetical protein
LNSFSEHTRMCAGVQQLMKIMKIFVDYPPRKRQSEAVSWVFTAK